MKLFLALFTLFTSASSFAQAPGEYSQSSAGGFAMEFITVAEAAGAKIVISEEGYPLLKLKDLYCVTSYEMSKDASLGCSFSQDGVTTAVTGDKAQAIVGAFFNAKIYSTKAAGLASHYSYNEVNCYKDTAPGNKDSSCTFVFRKRK